MKAVLLVASLLIASIGLLDFATGPAFRIFPLYFIPISLGAWAGRRRGALLFTLLATIAWAVSNPAQPAGASIWMANIVTQAIAFGSLGAMTAAMRRRFDEAVLSSRVDALTGLANARGFYEQAERVLARAKRDEEETTVAYLDLDDFKRVNDDKGHAEGDRVLQSVAQTVRGTLRESDLSGRLGGDEFAVVLPESNESISTAVLERLRESLLAKMKKERWPVSVSIGAIVLPAGARYPSLVELMKEADALMYEAKDRGKNALIIRQRSEPPQEF